MVPVYLRNTGALISSISQDAAQAAEMMYFIDINATAYKVVKVEKSRGVITKIYVKI